VGTLVPFPIGQVATGNGGVATAIKNTPGSIGYVSLAYGLGNHLATTAIQNKAGRFATPGIRGIAAAAATVSGVPAGTRSPSSTHPPPLQPPTRSQRSPTSWSRRMARRRAAPQVHLLRPHLGPGVRREARVRADSTGRPCRGRVNTHSDHIAGQATCLTPTRNRIDTTPGRSVRRATSSKGQGMDGAGGDERPPPGPYG
jgi:hypothetical protein